MYMYFSKKSQAKLVLSNTTILDKDGFIHAKGRVRSDLI